MSTISHSAVDPTDFTTFNPMLTNLQGNILKGHGRDHTMHIFLAFSPTKKTEVQKWLKGFAKENITSFKQQLKEREAFKRNPDAIGSMFCSILLTKDGLSYLNKDPTKLTDNAFKDGMQHRTNNPLNENIGKWESPLKQTWHMMVLLADHNELRMASFAKKLIIELTDEENGWNKSKLKTTGSVATNDIKVTGLHVEYGHVIRNGDGDGLEHNGYVDGISQPLFLKDEQDTYATFHNITDWNVAKFDPRAKAELVLFADPFVTIPDAYGSYFVFRKLEQDVHSFKTAEKNLGLDERGGASIVGRYEDGTPLTWSYYF